MKGNACYLTYRHKKNEPVKTDERHVKNKQID